MTGINWSDLVAKAGPIKVEEKPKKVKKTKPKAPVITWSRCNCSRRHKTTRTFLECAIGKQYVFNGENAHLKRPYFTGSGDWAVIEERWSEVYYSEHNNSYNNLQHLQVFIRLYKEFEDASDYFMKAQDGFSEHRDADLYKAVVKAAL